MTDYQGTLTCLRCGLTVGEDQAFTGCPDCRRHGVGANLYPDYFPWDRFRAPERGNGIFRWRRRLPLSDNARAVTLGEGDTPLIPILEMGNRIGVDRLYVKDESRNPTWSFKDRLAAMSISKAWERGADTVVVATTGNQGAAAAAYAAAAGLRCVILTLESVPSTMKVLMQAYGASVVACATSGDRWKVMREAVEGLGWFPVSGFSTPPIGSNPFGVDGYKSIAFELYEQLDGAPDYIVVPTAYGDGLMGILRGFQDLEEAGATESLPRLIASEPLGPYSSHLAGRIEQIPPRSSVAFSIAATSATWQGIEAIRRSGGSAVTVAHDADILRDQVELASAEGLYLEASSATALGAVRSLVADGVIGSEDTVVLIGTSTGLKDPETTLTALPPLESIRPTLTDLLRALGSHE